MGNLEEWINLICMSLLCGRKPKHPEGTYADMGDIVFGVMTHKNAKCPSVLNTNNVENSWSARKILWKNSYMSGSGELDRGGLANIAIALF